MKEKKMFKKKIKNKVFRDLSFYMAGVLDAVDALEVQKDLYGEIANINDLIELIYDNADKQVMGFLDK